MEISSEIRTRIIDAANQLYQDSGSERFPTVDQVRRAAKADMNTTSVVMKEWRRAQTAAPAAVAVAIPERINEAMTGALATLWIEAQELANETLEAAKAAWETERAEADTMRAELAEAYEAQAIELDDTRQALTAAQEAAQEAGEKQQQLTAELDVVSTRLHEVETREQSGQKRIEELQAELDNEKRRNERQAEQHWKEMAAEKNQSEQARQELIEKYQIELAAVAQELATVKARAEAQQEAAAGREKQADKLTAELEKAHQVAAEAREQLAGLAGQLKAVQEQNVALLAAIKPQAPKPKKTPQPKKTAPANV